MVSYYLQTLGCQMNKNDSERIVGLLGWLGLASAVKAEEADLIIVNTCSVRQTAEDRVQGLIHNWQELRKKNPKLIIAVTGCLPGRDRDGRLRKKLTGVDLFFGIEELVILPKWLRELNPDLTSGQDMGEIETDYLRITPRIANNFQAFITIQTGCNNYCTYCVVPYARGPEKNRPVRDILAEAGNLAINGCKEVTLLGQVVNNYQAPDKENLASLNPFKSKDGFAALLWEVNRIAGIERIHFTAPDPQYFSNVQIEALKLPRQANYLHLPAQSGDDAILKKMNRKYVSQQYIDLVRKIRQAKPDIALGTDLIVGFPGETDEQFAHTLDLYQQCDFDISYPAMYSQRGGTAAAKAFKDNVPYNIKKQRWQQVQWLMERITFRKNQKYLNKKVSVLVENYEKGVCYGHSQETKLVQFLGDEDLVGRIVEVEINKAEVWVLRGKVI